MEGDETRPQLETVDGAKAWAEANREDLESSRLGCEAEEFRTLNLIMPAKARELWDSGCYLAEKLRELGATEEHIRDMQMATGQRAFGGCAWRAAVDYVNEYATDGRNVERGGAELAEKRHAELFGE